MPNQVEDPKGECVTESSLSPDNESARGLILKISGSSTVRNKCFKSISLIIPYYVCAIYPIRLSVGCYYIGMKPNRKKARLWDSKLTLLIKFRWYGRMLTVIPGTMSSEISRIDTKIVHPPLIQKKWKDYIPYKVDLVRCNGENNLMRKVAFGDLKEMSTAREEA